MPISHDNCVIGKTQINYLPIVNQVVSNNVYQIMVRHEHLFQCIEYPENVLF